MTIGRIPIIKRIDPVEIPFYPSPEDEVSPLHVVHMWMADNLDESEWAMFGPAAHIALMHQAQKGSVEYRMRQLLLWWTGRPSIHTNSNSNFVYRHSLKDINMAHRSYHNKPQAYLIRVPHDHPFT